MAGVGVARGEKGDGGGVFGLVFFWALIGLGTWVVLTFPHTVTVSDGGTVTFRRPLGEWAVDATEIASIHWFGHRGPPVQWSIRGAIAGWVHVHIQFADGRGCLWTHAKYDALAGFMAAVVEHNPQVELSTTGAGLFGLGDRIVTVQGLYGEVRSEWLA